ncbi:unnamed protein product [Ilex paraguariensis]|uniref:Uncharacterized protein n=1 Tax=Ilex paraguariensis TaxID=185542 RepID=A0ABC8UB90_9AQUA
MTSTNKRDLPTIDPSQAASKELNVPSTQTPSASKVTLPVSLRLISTLSNANGSSLLANITLANTKILSILPYTYFLQAATHASALLGRVQKSEKAAEKVQDNLKLREIELRKIVGVVDSAELEKEKAKEESTELKKEVEGLMSFMKARDQIINDWKIECYENYANGYEDFKDQATKNFPNLNFDSFVPHQGVVEKTKEDRDEGEPDKQSTSTKLPLYTSTTPVATEGTKQ